MPQAQKHRHVPAPGWAAPESQAGPRGPGHYFTWVKRKGQNTSARRDKSSHTKQAPFTEQYVNCHRGWQRDKGQHLMPIRFILCLRLKQGSGPNEAGADQPKATQDHRATSAGRVQAS